VLEHIHDGNCPRFLFVAGFAGTRVSEQVQRYVDLLQQAFDFLALVWTQIFVHPFHQLLFAGDEIGEGCHV
jgi:hypothetical protein